MLAGFGSAPKVETDKVERPPNDKRKTGFETVCRFSISSCFVELSRKGGFMKKTWLSIGLGPLLALAAFAPIGRAQVPVFETIKEGSLIKFSVKASVPIAGTFDAWDSHATLTSPDLTSAVLDIKIQANSVNTGSGMKDGKLKGKDFFDVKNNPLITFHSTKVVQTGPTTVEFDGDFTIRGVTRTEKVTFTVTGKGTGTGKINGTMAFDRKDYGMNSGIPFIKIADRVEVTLDLKAKRVSGPPVVFRE
jgi:polyisoprenoid-binding protein YceI